MIVSHIKYVHPTKNAFPIQTGKVDERSKDLEQKEQKKSLAPFDSPHIVRNAGNRSNRIHSKNQIIANNTTAIEKITEPIPREQTIERDINRHQLQSNMTDNKGSTNLSRTINFPEMKPVLAWDQLTENLNEIISGTNNIIDGNKGITLVQNVMPFYYLTAPSPNKGNFKTKEIFFYRLHSPICKNGLEYNNDLYCKEDCHYFFVYIVCKGDGIFVVNSANRYRKFIYVWDKEIGNHWLDMNNGEFFPFPKLLSAGQWETSVGNSQLVDVIHGDDSTIVVLSKLQTKEIVLCFYSVDARLKQKLALKNEGDDTISIYPLNGRIYVLFYKGRNIITLERVPKVAEDQAIINEFLKTLHLQTENYIHHEETHEWKKTCNTPLNIPEIQTAFRFGDRFVIISTGKIKIFEFPALKESKFTEVAFITPTMVPELFVVRKCRDLDKVSYQVYDDYLYCSRYKSIYRFPLRGEGQEAFQFISLGEGGSVLSNYVIEQLFRVGFFLIVKCKLLPNLTGLPNYLYMFYHPVTIKSGGILRTDIQLDKFICISNKKWIAMGDEGLYYIFNEDNNEQTHIVPVLINNEGIVEVPQIGSLGHEQKEDVVIKRHLFARNAIYTQSGGIIEMRTLS